MEPSYLPDPAGKFPGKIPGTIKLAILVDWKRGRGGVVTIDLDVNAPDNRPVTYAKPADDLQALQRTLREGVEFVERMLDVLESDT